MNNGLLEATVGELVVQRPPRAEVFERYSIDYCCSGQRTLAEACGAASVATETILQELEQSDAKCEPESPTWNTLTELAEHIVASHHGFLREQLPRISELIAKVVAAHGSAQPKLGQVQQAFAALRAELEPHMLKEEQVLFPAIRQMEATGGAVKFPFGTVNNPIHCMMKEHSAAGDGLSTLRELTGNFQPPAGACPTYHAMLDGLQRLEADTHQHIHLENNILFPKAAELEAATLEA